MLIKNKTIKVRITFLSFVIMILTVSGIMMTDYVIQRSLPQISQVMMINEVEDVNYTQILAKVNAEYQRQQQLRFFWLTSVSLILLTAGMILIYRVIKKELQPLDRLKQDMDKMDFKNHNNKMIISQSNSEEIQSLTDAYNLMITNLKKSYESQKRFSQNAAHELRTPITTMKTSLQVNKMRKNKYDENTTNLLAVLENQVLRMEELISALLLLNSRQKIVKEPVDIRKLIEEIIASFQVQIEEKELEVSIKGKCTISTDYKIISVILKNIIENAIRYNNVKGTIEIDLGDSIKISDSGKGISKEEQENIFSPFYCVDESRSKEFGGLGLGLAIVKEGIDYLGLTINLSSDLGKGSSFGIDF